MKNKINAKDFVNEFKTNRVVNTKADPNAVSNFIKDRLDIVEYIPFKEKRDIVEMVVAQNIKEDNGIKRYDSIGSYMSFVVAMLVAHTALDMSTNPVDDYDELSRNGLLEPIVSTFKGDYDECDILLKMTIAEKLEDNNFNILVGKFLNGVLEEFNAFSDVVKEKLGNLNLKDIIDADIKEEDVTKLLSVLDKLK